MGSAGAARTRDAGCCGYGDLEAGLDKGGAHQQRLNTNVFGGRLEAFSASVRRYFEKYILKRFLQLIPVLVGITFLSFAMMRIAGSDAITELYGDKGAVAQEIIDAKRAELGLDQPFLTQYLAWVGGILTGDMGISYISGRDVFQTFVSKLPATLLLTVLAICATVIISIPLGVLAAVRHDKFTDYFLRVFSFIGNSLPNFLWRCF